MTRRSKKLDELIGKSVYGEGKHCHCYPMSEFKVLKQWRDWQALRAELAAERCENCAHVTLEHDNGTTVFCAHPEMWNNRDRDFCCSNFTKKGTTP